MIPYGLQDITEEDIEAVTAVLRSSYITQGPLVPQFERELCEYTGANHCVVANSATSCLHIACSALGLSENDILWTSPITFVASANCALYCGATVDFVDIEPESFNICPVELKRKLEQAAKVNKLPKILIAVHMAGQSPNMEEIFKLSQEYNFYIIEDASHAIGASYRDFKVGGCQYSDVTVFSFHPVKIITTAEGGAALTNNIDLSTRMSLLRSHGVTREDHLMENVSHGGWYYEQVALGYNYRMTEIQAALGISQLPRLDSYVQKRHEIAEFYYDAFKQFPVDVPCQNSNSYSSFHLFVIKVQLKKIHRSHQEVFSFLRENGVGVNLHYIPVHLHPYYQKLGFKHGDFPNAEQYYKQAISLPIYPALTKENINYVVASLKGALA